MPFEFQQARIVGGKYAGVNEFPWRCSLFTYGSGIFCGATVIDREWIMTAAHCTNSIRLPTKTLYVRCGEHDTSKFYASPKQMIKVDAIKQHPLYSTPDQVLFPTKKRKGRKR